MLGIVTSATELSMKMSFFGIHLYHTSEVDAELPFLISLTIPHGNTAFQLDIKLLVNRYMRENLKSMKKPA